MQTNFNPVHLSNKYNVVKSTGLFLNVFGKDILKSSIN